MFVVSDVGGFRAAEEYTVPNQINSRHVAEQAKKAKAAELAQELAEHQKIAEKAARLKAALSICPTVGSPARLPPNQETGGAPANQSAAGTGPAAASGGEVIISPLVNCDLELTAADLAGIGSGRVDAEELGPVAESRWLIHLNYVIWWLSPDCNG